ncbi:serine/threonine-protein kinase [Micromonospora qiuiae]|uniref:serine/threonine-protein kinase n=1 Tax=Micromonospora qiuiae TaxID=502268 RepID=UPI001950EC08|nr:serine/threonine-protein kinase [Micromonospora qiuiae]
MQARDRIGDRYELTYPIGRGGMGQVWAGYDERLDRPVAVKFLRQLEVPEDERDIAVKRFRREARATARLDHPGVPVVYDLGEHGDDLYLVMQLVRGIVLGDHIAEQERLPVREAASIAAQICSVLAAAHGASLVHRDLKPQNLMITSSGAVKVLDFGVAALLGPADASRLTTTGRTLGTPAYIAPEQAAGDLVGPAADLYALGCVLYEMLTGRPPYEAANAPEMLRRHMHSPIPVVTEHRPDVPDDLAHLLFCLLAKEPAERPPSAAQVEKLLVPFADEDAPNASLPAVPVPVPARPASSAAGPAPVRLSPQQLSEARAQAQQLAEHERFVQAAELLGRILRAAGGQPHAAETVALRMDIANLHLLAGDFRRACQEFEALADDLDQAGTDADLADECRQHATICRQELADPTLSTAAAVPSSRR